MSLLVAAPSPAAADPGYPVPGHYAGETSTILLGPARVQFDLVARDTSGHEVVGFSCGCGVGAPWEARITASTRFAASSLSRGPESAAFVELRGDVVSATRVRGRGSSLTEPGAITLGWTWAVERVPEMGPAASDAEAVMALSERAGALAGEASGAAAVPPTALRVVSFNRSMRTLTSRIVTDAEKVAAAEGLHRPAKFGPPPGASDAVRREVARLEADAQRAARQVSLRVRNLRTHLRQVSLRVRPSHPRLAAHGLRLATVLAARTAELNRDLR